MPPKINLQKLKKILSSGRVQTSKVLKRAKPAVTPSRFVSAPKKEWHAPELVPEDALGSEQDFLKRSRDRIEQISDKDPLFKKFEYPIERIGYQGKAREYVYGTRSADPWQLALALDMKHRLTNLGYDIETPYWMRRNGKADFTSPEHYIDILAAAPIDMMISKEVPLNIGGYRNKKTGRTALKISPETLLFKIPYLQLHESLMHGTDLLMNDIGVIPDLKIDIPLMYKGWADVSMLLPTLYSPYSSNWEELRATLGEFKSRVYKALAAKEGREFFNRAEITPELREKFNSTIDNLNAYDVMRLLRDINGYGTDYARILDAETWFGDDTYLKSLKNLIKYAPAFYLGLYALPTNYVEEIPLNNNLYKKGGNIHIKPENKGKFTETKKRTGKTTEELTHSKNPLTRKRAIFALNAKKWKH